MGFPIVLDDDGVLIPAREFHGVKNLINWPSKMNSVMNRDSVEASDFGPFCNGVGFPVVGKNCRF